jgi:hypothetical protein
MYKISLLDEYIIRKSDNACIPKDSGNRDYQQFLQDVKEQGLGIVEGPDITTESYATLRRKEYPPIEDQLDKIYHSTLTAWKADIKAIKDKYPKTITGGSTVGDVPAWVQTEVDKLNS